MNIFSWKICFRSPPRNRVLVVGKTGSDFIRKVILQEAPFTVFGTDEKTLYITPRILIRCHSLFWRFILREKREEWLNRGLSGKLLRIYFLSLVWAVKPKVVLTYVDDDPLFHWLSRHYKNAEFFAIQNSARTKRDLSNPRNHYNFTNFFCHGEYERDTFKEFGHHVERFIPVGSLRADYFLDKKIGTGLSEIKYDICLISQWTHASMKTDRFLDCKRAMVTLNNFLSQYVRERNIRLAISLRWNIDGQEKDYYQKVYGSDVVFIDRDDEKMATHEGMWHSDLVVAFFSTTAREAFGWGKKIVYYDASGHDEYTYYKDGPWIFRGEKYEGFAAHLDFVRGMSMEEYRERTKNYARYLMVCDPDKKAHQKIREHILQHL